MVPGGDTPECLGTREYLRRHLIQDQAQHLLAGANHHLVHQGDEIELPTTLRTMILVWVPESFA